MGTKFKTAKDLELSLLVKEAHIQQLKLKVEKLENYLWYIEEAILDYSMSYKKDLTRDDLIEMLDEVDFYLRKYRKGEDKE